MNKVSQTSTLLLAASGFLLFASAAFALGPSAATQAGKSPLRANVRACQAKENAVKQRSLQLAKLAADTETRFDTIAARVENFYASTATVSGHTVANYSVLAADIAIKKASVSAMLAVVTADATNFSCTNNGPKGQLMKFQTDMRAVKEALKNYRTSIKNLIVAVRSAVGKANE